MISGIVPRSASPRRGPSADRPCRPLPRRTGCARSGARSGLSVPPSSERRPSRPRQRPTYHPSGAAGPVCRRPVLVLVAGVRPTGGIQLQQIRIGGISASGDRTAPSPRASPPRAD
jgi:hypothetical protein